jgi:hypothetical protein
MQCTVASLEVDSAAMSTASLEKSAARNRATIWIIGAALVGLFLKLAIAYSTVGTNDVLTFYGFARSLSDHGLEWTYRHRISFNHPPLTAYYLCWIYKLDHLSRLRENGIAFPFLLRLPGIIADFVVVLLLLRVASSDARLRLSRWSLVLLALSPVSLMISGFHGNTDSVMAMFLVIASYLCLKEQAWLCGLFFALSCQIKVIPLLFFPIFFFFWMHRRAIVPFLLPFVLTSVVLWWEPLLNFPTLFIKNVLSYGSFWGIWGITYWLRMTGLPAFSWVWIVGFSPAQTVVATLLKILIVVSVFVVAWRRRALGGRGLIASIAYGWVIFFVFSPGVCVQYMVWLAPFILVLSPTFYGWLTATSSLFLFFFYNTTAHGLPWYLAISTNALNSLWTPWSLWPWAALLVGMILLWKKARAANPELRIFGLETLPAETRE